MDTIGLSGGLTWTIIGALFGSVLAILVNVLSHTFARGQERHVAWQERMTMQIDDTKATMQSLMREINQSQVTLGGVTGSLQELQVRVRSVEDKVNLFWRSVEEQLAASVRLRQVQPPTAPHEDV